jgi:hypothetical protein
LIEVAVKLHLKTFNFTKSTERHLNHLETKIKRTFMPKVKEIQEYVVEARDDHGHPAVIARAPAVAPSPLKKFDDQKLPRKRRVERDLLKSKNQSKLEELFWLPVEREMAEQSQREHEANLRIQAKAQASAVAAASDEEKDEVIPPSEVQEPPISQPSSRHIIAPQSNGLQLLHLYILLTLTFFSMALFPSFRKWVVEEIVIKLFIESISPPFLHLACGFAETFMDDFPVCANIMISLYNLLGFWVIAAGFLWLGYNYWDMLRFIATTAWMNFIPRIKMGTEIDHEPSN